MAGNAEWRALAARLNGFLASIELWQTATSHASNGMQDKLLFDRVRVLVADLDRFVQAAVGGLPAAAIKAFDDQRLRDIASPTSHGIMTAPMVMEAALRLRTIVAEVEYHLADLDEALRHLTERALLHLQWQIYSDNAVRQAWKAAFAAGETACEKLGATHLLWHGIFAFKASQRAITDLVLGEPVSASDSDRIATGLVLTEWKKVTARTDLPSAVARAEAQSANYATGVLGGAELRSVRFVIVVTEQQMPMPPDTPGQGFAYRHVNIACDPLSPSKAMI